MTDDPPGEDGTAFGSVGRESTLTYEIGAEERPSRAVVRAVASLTNTSVLDLEPLYEAVDPDHLDDLCGGVEADGPIRSCSIGFQFGGCSVSVDGAEIHVRLLEDGE